MRIAVVCCGLAALSVLLPAPQAGAQAIGVFTDPTAVSCTFSVQPLIVTTFYVVAAIGPQACAGIQGAEFRIAGLPENWLVLGMTPGLPILESDPGNPFADGARFTFASCQTSEAGLVPLMSVLVLPLTSAYDRVMTVSPHSASVHPELQCPLVVLCDPPTYTAQCVRGLIATINHQSMWCCQFDCTFPTCPPIAVDATTWSGMKSLYATP